MKLTENTKIALVIILCIVFCISIYLLNLNYGPKISTPNLAAKLDSIELKIDSIKDSRDSIKRNIITDQTHVKIIHEEYKKTISRIMHQSVYADSNDITKYIENYSRQCNSINSKTSQNN